MLQNALKISMELFPNCFDVNIRLQPSASMPDGLEPPWILTAAFCIFSTLKLSKLIEWIVYGVYVSNISWDASSPSGCFDCSWFNACPFKHKKIHFSYCLLEFSWRCWCFLFSFLVEIFWIFQLCLQMFLWIISSLVSEIVFWIVSEIQLQLEQMELQKM